MKLYVAEKPSLARAIVDVLPKPHQKAQGYIKVGNGDIVSWCIGHLLEQAPPDAYDPKYKKWQIHDLPILPERWQLLPKKETHQQLTILLKLLQQADAICHVGDPDREGQLLIDEVLHYANLSTEKLKNVKRCLISDLNAAAVEKALQNMCDNVDFIPLSTSALARARADWLYGMNLSRLCTLKGQQRGYRGVLSVGRVQTPILGLVVRRDLEIEHFKSKPFYEVFAHLQTENNDQFRAKWQPSEACEPYQDEEGRVLLKSLAENVVQRIENQTGIIDSVTKKKRELAAPLPYNLSGLQIDAAKQFNLSAQKVLDICQDLYEKYKLITYPRSDCRYLPKAHFAQREQILQTILQNCADYQTIITASDPDLTSKCWDDKKVGAHHAIIPTLRKHVIEKLSENHQKMYRLIALQYIAQFYPSHKFTEQIIVADIAGGKFVTKAIQVVEQGWKCLFSKSQENEKDSDDPQTVLLTKVEKGDAVLCIKGELVEKETQPPRYFTDATLLSAMTGIARFVQNPDVKKILRETDGLGTEATRAGIIELLFKRQFLQRKGKQIYATEAGKQFILQLPEQVTTPDMTAFWEMQLDSMTRKEQRYHVFMHELIDFLEQLIVQIKNTSFSVIKRDNRS